MNDTTFSTSTTPFAATLRRAALLVLLTGSLAACSVMRDQQTVGQYTDDAKITAEIKSNMATDKTVAATAISVETLNGVTQLSGFAKSQAEKDRAAQIAREAKGVRSVRNDIVVRP
jgi:hyperosmotically inducible protein